VLNILRTTNAKCPLVSAISGRRSSQITRFWSLLENPYIHILFHNAITNVQTVEPLEREVTESAIKTCVIVSTLFLYIEELLLLRINITCNKNTK